MIIQQSDRFELVCISSVSRHGRVEVEFSSKLLENI
ncbi:MAG: hypothetical protein ACI9UR_000639 [Bacteroidia bacterium]|jgi:hypothetical protein